MREVKSRGIRIREKNLAWFSGNGSWDKNSSAHNAFGKGRRPEDGGRETRKKRQLMRRATGIAQSPWSAWTQKLGTNVEPWNWVILPSSQDGYSHTYSPESLARECFRASSFLINSSLDFGFIIPEKKPSGIEIQALTIVLGTFCVKNKERNGHRESSLPRRYAHGLLQ